MAAVGTCSSDLGQTLALAAKLQPLQVGAGHPGGWAKALASSRVPRAEPHRYLFRAMRSDLYEFLDMGPPALRGGRLAGAALEAVDRGSHFRSPWLHASWSFLEARNWMQMGVRVRGEIGTILVRVDTQLSEALAKQVDIVAAGVVALSLDTCMLPGKRLDFSIDQRAKRTLAQWSGRPLVQVACIAHGVCVEEGPHCVARPRAHGALCSRQCRGRRLRPQGERDARGRAPSPPSENPIVVPGGRGAT